MMYLTRDRIIYRGGACKTGMAFYTFDKNVASMYGKLCGYKPKRRLKLFKLTHSSLKSVFKYISNNTKLLMKFIFGTDTSRNVQRNILKKLTGERTKTPLNRNNLGQRLSLSEIDSIAFRALSNELRGGYDGIYVPPRLTKFHKGGVFHSEIFISKRDVLIPVHLKKQGDHKHIQYRKSKSIFSNVPMTELFIIFSKGTRGLLKPHPRKFVMFLGGGMAVKLYLRARGISSAKTSDFDFKFALPNELRKQTDIDNLSEIMKRIMTRHMNAFVRFLNRNGIPSTLEIKELKGVPLDKPSTNPKEMSKKVYKVYNFSIHSRGKKYELVDTSLVVVPGISRKKHISLKWSRKFGFPIQTLTRLWKDTLYVLAGSFVYKKTMLRNPIDGQKKEKGIKNAIRTGHLSYLTSKRKGTAHLVHLARKLIEDIATRNKKSGIKNSKEILKQLKLMQKLDMAINSR